MSRVVQLQKQFEDVSDKMADLPVFNTELSVATVGFTPYQHGELGVLVTPWCMNLIMLPENEEEMTESIHPGSKQMLALPSGHYEFIWGSIEGIGNYQSCSLFSPMFEFESQEQAVETAEEIMKALFVTENYAPTDRQIAAKADPEKGKTTQDKLSEEPAKQPSKQSKQPGKPAQLSRRGFLTAGFSRRALEPGDNHESL
ncbi:MAG: [NiFe]-hydrogenase assembly chaperone HybE [Neptuniibacter sp.]